MKIPIIRANGMTSRGFEQELADLDGGAYSLIQLVQAVADGEEALVAMPSFVLVLLAGLELGLVDASSRTLPKPGPETAASRQD